MSEYERRKPVYLRDIDIPPEGVSKQRAWELGLSYAQYLKVSDGGREGWVYCIGAPGWDRVKIGWSTDPIQRKGQLETGAGRELVLLAAVRGKLRHERGFHRRFAAHSIGREWFHYADEIREWVAECQPVPDVATHRSIEYGPPSPPCGEMTVAGTPCGAKGNQIAAAVFPEAGIQAVALVCHAHKAAVLAEIAEAGLEPRRIIWGEYFERRAA